ncbi:MAG: CPBP family intramembrane glutamic endopeptidase [bacterium]
MKITLVRNRLRMWRIIEFILISLFPVSIITFGLAPSVFRYAVLLGIAVYAGSAIFYRKWTRHDLGFRKDTLIFWKPYLVWTVLAMLTIIVVHHVLHMPFITWDYVTLGKLIAISILLSCIQEFLYRGYLFRLFQDITHHVGWVVVINIIVFTYMHTIFPHWEIIIPLTAAGGILFAVLYKKYPNVYLVSAMHCVLNFTALYLGFFPVELLHMH